MRSSMIKLCTCFSLIAIVALLIKPTQGAQDILIQPPPMTVSAGPIVAPAQSFDRPVDNARSPRNANYTIEVKLDHITQMLTGHETIHWRNISEHQTTELQFHLYWNAWQDQNSSWLRERQLSRPQSNPDPTTWGWMKVTSIRVGLDPTDLTDLTTQQQFISPDDDNAKDQTVMTVQLPEPVDSGQSVEIQIDWTAKIPKTFARTGYRGNYYFIAHWFPKIGVLEDRGWNTHQFHSVTEFYADFGIYDVKLTVPEQWVVGASGREIGRTANTNNTTTHHYRGEDIHDFAWTTSPDFVEVRRKFEHANLTPVDMRLLLQPEHITQADRHFSATAAALEHYGNWFGPYPYSYLTIVDPAYQSRSGGMEYPTLFTSGTRWWAPRDVAQPEGVTLHEAGHQFWYGLVASNEFEHAWMDEGLNTFSEARVAEVTGISDHLSRRFFGGFVPWVFQDIELPRATYGNGWYRYRVHPNSEIQATPTYRYWPGTATSTTYFKTALWLHTLERHLGWPTLKRIMATYFEQWQFRHPSPHDFFRIANEVSGQDLTTFFDQVYRGSQTFDYAVQDLKSQTVDDKIRTTVVVQRLGDGIFPVDVITKFRDGTTKTEHWDGQERRVLYVYETSSDPLSVEVDPNRILLLDINFTNNSLTREPQSSKAALKWTLKWIVWLQDLMLTYGFFV